MARRAARELAFRTLFQAERGSSEVLGVWRQVKGELAHDGEAELGEVYGEALEAEGIDFAEALLTYFAAHREEIDAALASALEGWSFGQMAQTDLNVLRLAIAELELNPATPKEVVIEVAIRIAKRFGGEESGRFVNGVLGKLVRQRALSP